MSEQDLLGAVRAEFRESEVFPPTDSVEDWLKLLDYDPDNVVRVKPRSAAADRPAPAGASGSVI